MFYFIFTITYVRSILNMRFRRFGRENKRTVIKENDNIFGIAM